MLRVLLVLLVVGVTVYAAIETRRADATEVRGLSPRAWLAVVLLLPPLGALAWFLVGRPTRGRPPRNRAVRRPVAPDDDPDFLRRLAEERAQQEEDDRLLRSWEEDRRRREGRSGESPRADGDDDDDRGGPGSRPQPR